MVDRVIEKNLMGLEDFVAPNSFESQQRTSGLKVINGLDGIKLWFDTSASYTIFNAVKASSDTATLELIGESINTLFKYQGKRVWNTTTGKPVWATGSNASDVWVDASGATAHTPI